MANNIFQSYMSGQQFGGEQGRNALLLQQALEEKQKKDLMRNILARAYRPGVEAIPGLPEAPAMGPLQPGAEPLPAYPEQAPIAAQAPGGQMPEAIQEMYRQGLGPEAMAYEKSMLTAKGQAPAAVREYQFYQTLTPEEQRQYQTVKRQGYSIQDVAGVPTLVSTVPGLPSIPLSTFKAELGAAAEEEKAGKLGALAAGQIKTAVETIPKISRNINNLDEVVRLIEQEGAVTGPVVGLFPSFRTSSVELENLQKELGLDVIGAVTFGALSKGELDLALSKALPTQLKGPQLVDWAKRKKNAQEKLRDYFQQQINYLSQPGNTVAGWFQQQSEVSRGTQQETPKIGEIQDGYVFIGGDPADPKSWKKQ